MQRDTSKVQLGTKIAEWLRVKVPTDCCNIYKTINAWGPSLSLHHIRTVATLLMDERKIPQVKYPLVKLLIKLAVADDQKKIKEKYSTSY
jgi:hypothetical protein